jgi:hypothetical protein
VYRFKVGSRFVDVVNVTTHYTSVGTMNATFVLVASIAAITDSIIHTRRVNELWRTSNVPTVKFAIWTCRSSRLIGAVETIAEVVVETISCERFGAIFAFDNI